MTFYQEQSDLPISKDEINVFKKLVDQRGGNQAQLFFNQLIDRLLPTETGLLIEFSELALLLGESEYLYEAFDALLKEGELPAQLEPLYAHICYVADRKELALSQLRRVVQSNESDYRCYIDLASLLMGMDYREALDVIQKAIELFPDDARLYSMYAECMVEEGNHSEVVKSCEKSFSLTDDSDILGKTFYVLGQSYSQYGEKQQAVENLETALEFAPLFGPAYFSLAQTKTFEKGDVGFLQKVESVMEMSMLAKDRAFISFALGKYFDDLREYQQAFAYYKKGNALSKSNLRPFPHSEIFSVVKEGVSEFTINDHWPKTDIPIFILGMPRSGSTLVEQIVASHSKVGSVGESADIFNIVQKIFEGDEPADAQTALEQCFLGGELKDLVQEYIQTLKDASEGADVRVIDKQPSNYLFIGLIVKLFPEATILHTVRDPLDTCLSCYFQPFVNVPWSFDLNWIGDEYIFYREVMDYWRSVLPEGTIVDISYDELVDNFEQKSREIIAKCGLSWESECLTFHNNKRKIRTASISQVRQPIYGTSRERWRNYEEYIGSLVLKLDKYVDQSVLERFQGKQDLGEQHNKGIREPKATFLMQCITWAKNIFKG